MIQFLCDIIQILALDYGPAVSICSAVGAAATGLVMWRQQ